MPKMSPYTLYSLLYLGLHTYRSLINFTETFVEGEVMSHAVLPSRWCILVKREVVQDPVVDFLHWQSFGWGIFDSHEDEARERVRRLGSRMDLSKITIILEIA